MAQSGWRLPPELLKRVRVRCAESGVRQNVFVERALESALGGKIPDSVEVASPAASEPSRASAPKLPAGVKTARGIASERQAALNKAKKT